jgi:hypothetical protein
MAGLLWKRMSVAGDVPIEGLIDAIEHEPIEI